MKMHLFWLGLLSCVIQLTFSDLYGVEGENQILPRDSVVISDTLGIVTLVYDAQACECILQQNAMMQQEIVEILARPAYNSYWLFRRVEYNQDRTEAERMLALCRNLLLPVVVVTTQEGEFIFESSGYLEKANFLQTLDLITQKIPLIQKEPK